MEERPLECSQCKKKADVIYSEVESGAMATHHMCRDCPVLQLKLHGKSASAQQHPKPAEEELCCSQCRTSLESILMGEPLGCKECYQIFQEVLLDQLIETEKISPRLKPTQTPTFHIGKSPHVPLDELTSNRILELNEALSEALRGENYEQAAWLRDQINSLMEKSDEI